MLPIPVLFEDHTLTSFRPACWSQPVYEQRVGLFNLRERVERLLPVTATGGRLLSRKFLHGLHPESPWRIGTGEEEVRGLDSTFLWINGRLAPDHNLVAQILALVEKGETVAWQDKLGTLAFTCSAAESRELMASYELWERTQADAGVWSKHSVPSQPWGAPGELDSRRWQSAEGLGFIWEVVPATSGAIMSDLVLAIENPGEGRTPFGVFPLPEAQELVWTNPLSFARWEGETASNGMASPAVTGGAGLYLGPDVQLGFGLAVDTQYGPVILDRGTVVQPHVFLEGPLYVGPGSTIKSGATIYGESTFGIMNKLAGEIGESTFGDFSNKQHEGFIGHAVLGSWVNLGAMTTCSDLKNNYGPVRVDLGLGSTDSGLRFVGLMMADHAKTAIGTLFNTGTCVGFASNIFGGGMPPKFVSSFSWGGQDGSPVYASDKAVETARVVMARRGCRLTEGHETLFHFLAP